MFPRDNGPADEQRQDTAGDARLPRVDQWSFQIPHGQAGSRNLLFDVPMDSISGPLPPIFNPTRLGNSVGSFTKQLGAIEVYALSVRQRCFRCRIPAPGTFSAGPSCLVVHHRPGAAEFRVT